MSDWIVNKPKKTTGFAPGSKKTVSKHIPKITKYVSKQPPLPRGETNKRVFIKYNPFPCPSLNDALAQEDGQNKELFDEIVTKLLRDSVPDKDGQPTAILMAGPIASGKTSVLNNFVKTKLGREINEFASMSVDEVLEELPEYKKAIDILKHINLDQIIKHIPELDRTTLDNIDQYVLTSQQASDSCRDISRYITRDLLLPKIMAEKRDFIYDSTARNVEYYKDLVKELHTLGYNVIILYVTAGLSTIQKRTKERADKMGRYIDEETVKFVFNVMKRKKVFESLCGLADECYLYNNQFKPILAVEKGKDNILKCHDIRFLEGIIDEDSCAIITK